MVTIAIGHNNQEQKKTHQNKNMLFVLLHLQLFPCNQLSVPKQRVMGRWQNTDSNSKQKQTKKSKANSKKLPFKNENINLNHIQANQSLEIQNIATTLRSTCAVEKGHQIRHPRAFIHACRIVFVVRNKTKTFGAAQKTQRQAQRLFPFFHLRNVCASLHCCLSARRPPETWKSRAPCPTSPWSRPGVAPGRGRWWAVSGLLTTPPAFP